MRLEELHEVRFAVKGQLGHVFDRDVFSVVFFYILQDRFELFQCFRLNSRFILTF